MELRKDSKEWLGLNTEEIPTLKGKPLVFVYQDKVKDKLLELQAEIEALQDNQWINVEDDLPDEKVNRVIVINNDGYVWISSKCKGDMWGDCGWPESDSVTHWKPIPNPPKGQ